VLNILPSVLKHSPVNPTSLATSTTQAVKPVRARNACHIRPANFADHAQISILGKRYALTSKDYEEWSHLWLGNPAYLGLENWIIGWVLENNAGEIVGHIANIPSRFELNRRSLLAASGSGLVVDERYRSYAMPLFSQFVNQSLPDVIINNSVNAQGLTLHNLFHFERVPAGTWNSSDFWITQYSGFADKLVESKNWPKSLSFVVGAGLRLKNAFHRHPRTALRQGMRLDILHSFDSRFDDFWSQLRSLSPAILKAHRSRETLNWHFKYPLANGAAWIVTVSKESRIVAYAVFLRQDSAEVELKRVRLVDFQTLDGNMGYLSAILDLALRKCGNEKIHMLEAIGFSPEKRRVISRLAPHHRELPCWLYFYKTNNEDVALRQQLTNPHAWDPSPFDGDGSL
jgi:hypothetical protein